MWFIVLTGVCSCLCWFSVAVNFFVCRLLSGFVGSEYRWYV